MKNKYIKRALNLLVVVLGIIIFPVILVALELLRNKGFNFYIFDTARIGHFLPDFFIEYYSSRDSKRTFYLIPTNSCNSFLNRWASRELKTLPFAVFYLLKVYLNLPRYNSLVKQPPLSKSRDIHCIGRFYGSLPQFLPDENELCLSWLFRNGWKGSGQKIITLMLRDSKYLKQTYTNKDWSYHDYRNSDVSLYSRAVQWLLSRGYFVIRMGNVAHSPLDIMHPSFVDYPFINDQSEMLDLWLFANSDFCITNGSGADILAGFHLKPTLMINFLPLVITHTMHPGLSVPKRLFSRSLNRYLRVDEMLCQATFYYSQAYIEANLIYSDLSEDEIFKSVGQFIDVFDNNGFVGISSERSTLILKTEIGKLHPGHMHDYIHPRYYLSNLPFE